MKLTQDLADKVGVRKACAGLEVSRASFYRWRNPKPAKRQVKRTSHRALNLSERKHILSILLSEKYADYPARQVYFDLLGQGIYLASIRTLYRILASEKMNLDRRNLRRHPKYVKPVLESTAPNQVWTWDITLLASHQRRECFYLSVVLDMYSRFVVGWMISPKATAELGQLLVSTAMDRQDINSHGIILHSDRGSQMKSSTWKDLEQMLDLTRSFSRPRVSNDNPYVESHFKTMKYRPIYPGKFHSFEDAKGFCQKFFKWYNLEHYHSGIADLTPFSVYYGIADRVLSTRQFALDEAYKRNPVRFSKSPQVQYPPKLVGINHVQEVNLEHVNLI